MYETTRETLAAMDKDCPLCGGIKTLQKHVNEDHDEIWICTECPAVLFTYWYPEQIRRVGTILRVPVTVTPDWPPS